MAPWCGQGVPASDASPCLRCASFWGRFRGDGSTPSAVTVIFPVLNLSSAIWEQELKAIILLALLCVIPFIKFLHLKSG